MKFKFRCIKCGLQVKHKISFEINANEIEISIPSCNNCIKNAAKIDIENGFDQRGLNIKNFLLQKYGVWESIPIEELRELIGERIKNCLCAEEIFKLGDLKSYHAEQNKWCEEKGGRAQPFEDNLLGVPNLGKKSIACFKSVLDLFNIRIG